MSLPQNRREDAARTLIDSAIQAGKLTDDAGKNLTRWLSEPFYVAYQERLLELIENSEFAELNRLFWERIPFGTGGRRGPMSEFGSAMDLYFGGDMEACLAMGGQVAGRIDSIEPVADILRTTVEGFFACLDALASQYSGA